MDVAKPASHALAVSRSFGFDQNSLPAVLVPADKAENGLAFGLPADQLKTATHLSMDMELDSDIGGVLIIGFWPTGAKGASIAGRFGLLPRVPTRITLPLSVLDGQTLFLPRTPLRLKATVQGRRTMLDELGEVVLSLAPHPGVASLRLLSGPALYETQPPYPPVDRVLVDSLGQWADRDWPGKTRDEAELVAMLRAARAEAQQLAPAPQLDRTSFGGSSSHSFGATGFFRTHNDGKRWRLVDPQGGAFFSVGPDCVRPDALCTVVPGTERNFAWLGEPTASSAGTVDFASANLWRAFGDESFVAWCELTRGLMIRYGFNTVGNWSDPRFSRGSGLPYVIPMPDLETRGTRLFRSLPDVFDPQFAAACEPWAEFLRPFAGDSRLVGYFMTNEPDWAFGKHNLASEMLEANPNTHTRAALVKFIRDRYGEDNAAWTTAWNSAGKTFDALSSALWRRAELLSTAAYDDLFDFSRRIVRRWVGALSEACRKVTPNHLNLGVRWAWISSDLCYEVAPWCDVFTINNYNTEPPLDQLTEVEKRTGRPVIIGEFHHGATDRGLPSSGISAVASTAERGVAYQRYVELSAAHPACIGAHYFQFADQPFMGRFDGENYNIGMVDVCQRPYIEFLDYARTTHGRLPAITAGKLLPTTVKPKSTYSIYF